ncbi:MAG TPA: hypothetical protein ENG94_08015 [Actinobacteria bacterium]|nr:hypothetical protein [Actinomycetota bacterium]
MAFRFLTDEWAAAVTEALRASDAFTSSANMSLQFVVTDAPEGEAKFYMDATGDTPVQRIG